MAKNIVLLLLVCFFYSCDVDKRRNDVTQVITEERIITIVERDTIYVEIDIEPNLAEKYEIALRKYIGLREESGNNDGEVIAEILRNCGINFPAAWCACYLYQGFLDIDYYPDIDQPAWTPNWFKDKKRIRWQRDKDPYSMRFEKGWTGGIYFRNLGRIAHVAAILEDFGDMYVLTIEGNTNSQGAREGDGVFLRIRHKSEFYKVSDWLTIYD